MKKSQIFLIVLLTTVLLSACGGNNTSSNNSNNTKNQNNAAPVNDSTTTENGSADQGTRFSIADLAFDLGTEEANECANNIISLDFFDEDAINEIRTDGLAVKETIENSFPMELTFCAVPTSSATLEKLEEFDSLMASGQTDQALQLIADYVLELEHDLLSQTSTPHTAAPALIHDFGQTREFVRQMIAIAGRLQQQGSDDEAEKYMNKARDAFRKFGFEELDLLEDNYREALSIAAEAQGLGGLDDLANAAIEKAKEIIERLLPPAFEAFDPCISTEADVNYLDELLTTGQGIGVKTAENLSNEFYSDKLPEWRKVQDKRKRGENVPECPNTYKLNIDMVFGESPNTIMYKWDGFFQIDENQDIKGNLSGTLNGNLAEMECLLFTDTGTETVFNPATYKGSARIALTGNQIGEDENATLKIYSPEDNLSNATMSATYGNPDCGGQIEFDFAAQIFKTIMASPMTFIGYGMGTPNTYLELDASAPQNLTITAIIGKQTGDFIITLKDQSDNN